MREGKKKERKKVRPTYTGAPREVRGRVGGRTARVGGRGPVRRGHRHKRQAEFRVQRRGLPRVWSPSSRRDGERGAHDDVGGSGRHQSTAASQGGCAGGSGEEHHRHDETACSRERHDREDGRPERCSRQAAQQVVQMAELAARHGPGTRKMRPAALCWRSSQCSHSSPPRAHCLCRGRNPAFGLTSRRRVPCAMLP